MNTLPLNPIHLPADPGWWPPAPGWWLLALLLLALLIGLAVHIRQRQKKRALTAWIAHQMNRIEQSGHWQNEQHQLLRRAICALVPALKQADQTAWQNALLALASDLPIDQLLAVENSLYQPQPSDELHKQAAHQQAEQLLTCVLLTPKQARKRLENAHG